jgi:ribosome recycling factor
VITKEVADKMNKAIQILQDSLIGIRSGAVTASLIDTFKVPYYGQQTPIKHLAQTTHDAKKVVITPYDPALMGEIASSLKAAGFNAYVFSKTSVVISTPPLCGEDRERVKKQVRKLGEEAKISVRAVRRQYRQKADNKLSDDERQQIEDDLNNLTEQAVSKIDQIVWNKLEVLG